MKLIVTIPANTEEADIAGVIEEITRPMFGFMPVEWKLAIDGKAMVDVIDNEHARRDNRVA